MVIIGFLAIGEESSAGHKLVDAITHVVGFFSHREIDRDILNYLFHLVHRAEQINSAGVFFFTAKTFPEAFSFLKYFSVMRSKKSSGR